MTASINAPVRYLHSLDDPEVGTEIFLCCRESTDPQERAGNLTKQIANKYYEVGRRRKRVVGHITHTGGSHDRIWLRKLNAAALKAKQLGATLLAESADRYIRHPDYHPAKRPDLQGRVCDLKELASWLAGCPAATLLPPDATPAAVRAYQTRRGMLWAKAAPDATAGYKVRQRRRWLRPVLFLRRGGATLAQIEEWTGISKMTASRWIDFWEN